MAAKAPRKREKPMKGSSSYPEPGRVYEVKAPLPPSGIIYEGNFVMPVEEFNNNPNPVNPGSSGDEEKEEEGGTLESQGRQRERLYSSNLEIIQTKLKLRNQVNGEDDNKVDGESYENQVVKEDDDGITPGKTKKRSRKKEKKKCPGGEERLFHCEHCDYMATQKISLLRHLQVHAGKTFSCDEADCGKSYRWEVDLKRHKQSAHSNVSFPCPESDCDYLGSSQRNLASHQKSKHSGPRSDLVCHICDYQFTSSNYLEVHFKSRHLGQREVCSVCGEDFATKSILQRHVKEKHEEGDVKEKCEFCDKTFTRKTTRENHVKKVHQGVIEIEK